MQDWAQNKQTNKNIVRGWNTQVFNWIPRLMDGRDRRGSDKTTQAFQQCTKKIIKHMRVHLSVYI